MGFMALAERLPVTSMRGQMPMEAGSVGRWIRLSGEARHCRDGKTGGSDSLAATVSLLCLRAGFICSPN